MVGGPHHVLRTGIRARCCGTRVHVVSLGRVCVAVFSRQIRRRSCRGVQIDGGCVLHFSLHMRRTQDPSPSGWHLWQTCRQVPLEMSRDARPRCLMSLCLGVFAYIMIRKDMCWLPMCSVPFAVLSVVVLVVSLITLVPNLFGRTSTTTWVVSSVDGTTTYQTSTTTSAFFDTSMSLEYNLESASFLVTSIVALYATGLGFWSCCKVQAEAAEGDPEAGWLGAGGGQQSSGGGSVVNPGGQRAKPRTNFNTFSGQGQTLGDK